jgi:hypothetical protein
VSGSCICIFDSVESRGQCLGFGHVLEHVQRGSYPSHSGCSSGKYGEKVLAICRVCDVSSAVSSDVECPFVDIIKVKATFSQGRSLPEAMAEPEPALGLAIVRGKS